MIPGIVASQGGAGVLVSTWSPVDKHGDIALSGGNLIATLSGANGSLRAVRGTVGRSSGTHSFEATSNAGGFKMIGLATASGVISGAFYPGSDLNGYGYEQSAGSKYRNGSGAGYGATYTTGDVIRCEVDFSAGTITFYKNGVSQGTAFTGIVAGTYYPCVAIPNNGGQWTGDFTNW